MKNMYMVYFVGNYALIYKKKLDLTNMTKKYVKKITIFSLYLLKYKIVCDIINDN